MGAVEGDFQKSWNFYSKDKIMTWKECLDIQSERHLQSLSKQYISQTGTEREGGKQQTFTNSGLQDSFVSNPNFKNSIDQPEKPSNSH